MSKKILVMMLIIISAISFVKQPNLNVMADEKAKIEIWSESLNERIEHRSIEVGNSNPNFSIKVWQLLKVIIQQQRFMECQKAPLN